MANYITNVTIDGTQVNIKDAETSNNLTAHINANNPHHISKDTIGLGNVNNTSDGDKSVKDAKALSNLFSYDTRPTSANITFGDGKVRYFIAGGTMVEGKPAYDAAILHLAWDSKSGWDSQIAMLCNGYNHHIQFRAQDFGPWGNWLTVLDSDNFKDYTLAKTDTITNAKIDSICV